MHKFSMPSFSIYDPRILSYLFLISREINDYLSIFSSILLLQSYLNKYKFANAETKDLWNSLTEVRISILLTAIHTLFNCSPHCE